MSCFKIVLPTEKEQFLMSRVIALPNESFVKNDVVPSFRSPVNRILRNNLIFARIIFRKFREFFRKLGQ